MPPIQLLELHQYPILDQLRLEEALIRAGTDNYCLLNRGTPPAVVLGISGKIERLVNVEVTRSQNLPLIRRFSGGGTVVVDENTLFVSLIGNHSALDFPVFPPALMQWSSQFYAPLLGTEFQLLENDYALGTRKFGGNAQYLRKDRWLHHSSLLWDYSEERMNCLLLPEKRPAYRQARAHEDFLCALKPIWPEPTSFLSAFVRELSKVFEVERVSLGDLLPLTTAPHRKATRVE